MADQESLAREALLELTDAKTIGALLSRTVAEDGVVTLVFVADLSGYAGWNWTVSVAELPGEEPTVLEAELLPGPGALLAPDWVPWAERLEEYRAAQAAAAAEAGESEDSDEDADDDDDESDDDDLDEDDDDDDDSDDDDDEDDDFDDLDEDDDPLAVAAARVDEQDEAQAESDDDGPEPPDEA